MKPAWIINSDGMIEISGSAIDTAEHCLAEFKHAYLTGIRAPTIVDGALNIGTLWHGAHEFIFHENAGNAIGEYIHNNVTNNRAPGVTAKATVLEMMKQKKGYYSARNSFEPQLFTKHKEEVKGCYQLSDRTLYTWTMDGLVQSDTPFIWGGVECEPGLYMRELKTAALGRVNDVYIKNLLFNRQVQMYMLLGMKQWGLDIKGCLYDVASKPVGLKAINGESEDDFVMRIARGKEKANAGKLGSRLRRKVGESEDAFMARRIVKGRQEVAAYRKRVADTVPGLRAKIAAWYKNKKPSDVFHRFVLMPDESVAREFLRDAKAWARMHEDMILNWEDERWRMNTKACVNFNRLCQYHQICTTLNDPAIIEMNYVRRKARKAVDEAPF